MILTSLMKKCSKKQAKITVHEKNLEVLMIEVYKCLHSLNPEFMWSMFLKKKHAHVLTICAPETLTLPEAKSSIGLNSIIFRGALAWNNLPKEINPISPGL